MLHVLRFAASVAAVALASAPASAATILINFAGSDIGVSEAGTQDGTAAVTGSILIDTALLPPDSDTAPFFAYETFGAPFYTTSLTFSGDSRATFGGTQDITNRLRGQYGAGGYIDIGDERTVENSATRFESAILAMTFDGTVGQQTVGGFVLPSFALGQLFAFRADSNSNDFDADGLPANIRNISMTGQVGITGVTVTDDVAAVPEPATWATMVLGFGLAGAAVRRRRVAARA